MPFAREAIVTKIWGCHFCHFFMDAISTTKKNFFLGAVFRDIATRATLNTKRKSIKFIKRPWIWPYYSFVFMTLSFDHRKSKGKSMLRPPFRKPFKKQSKTIKKSMIFIKIIDLP